MPCHVVSFAVLDEGTLEKEMGLRDVPKKRKRSATQRASPCHLFACYPQGRNGSETSVSQSVQKGRTSESETATNLDTLFLQKSVFSVRTRLGVVEGWGV